MQKTIRVRTDSSFGTAQLLPGLPTSTQWLADVLSAMLEVGILTSPPRYRAFHLSTFWAWLRYGAAVSNRHAELRLRALWSQIDPHQKTILSDDFGMAFPALFLKQNFAFEDFADTRYVLDRLLQGVAAPAGRAANGAAKLPDFIATDSVGRLHILECKGTQIHRYLRHALARGVEQKNNVSNGGIFASCMVSGLFVPQHRSQSGPELVFVDPVVDHRLKLLEERVPKGRIIREVRRQSLAKALSAAGLWQTASAIGRGAAPSEYASFVKNLVSGELSFAGFARDGGRWVKEIKYRAFEQREDPSSDIQPSAESLEPVDTTLRISLPDDLMRTVSEAVQPEGNVRESIVDAWVTSTARSRRAQRPQISIPVVRANKTLRATKTSSAWASEEQPAVATVTTTADVQFSLRRQLF
jgi:hypothetical protein